MRFLPKPLAAALALALALPGALPARAGEGIPITHYGTGLYGMPFAVALAKGYFKEAGLDIDGIITAPGGGTAVRNVLANTLPYGEAGILPIIAAKNAGNDVVIVNASVDSAADAVFVGRLDGTAASIHDLVGRKVAITQPKSGSEFMLKMALSNAGIDLAKVQLVAAGGVNEGLQLLRNGSVDAAILGEPLFTREAAKYKVVVDLAKYIPEFAQTVGFTTRAYASQNADKIRAIVAARRRAVDDIYADPKAAAKHIAKAYERVPEALLEQVIVRMAAQKYWSRGDFTKAGLAANVKGLQLVKVIDVDRVDWNALIDQSYLPADLQRPL
jgi:NitT/TauT family transport system substrate-binding protein